MSFTHLLDTSVYCQPLKKQPIPAVEKRWKGLGDDSLCISVICEAEILQGLEAKGSDQLWRAYQTILKDRIALLPVDLKVAVAYGQIAGQLMKQRRPRPPFDLLIAATAKTYGLTIATLNFTPFKDIQGLKVEDWSE